MEQENHENIERTAEKQAGSHGLLSDIGNWIRNSFNVDTDSIYKQPENDEEKLRIKKIRKITAIEFYASLFGTFGLMWLMWWPGVIAGNDLMVNTSFVLIGLIGVWAILISPFFHYKLEKGITYRPGYLGLNYEQNGWTAFFEERGFGSVKRHLIMLKEGDEKYAKTNNFVSLYIMLSLILTCLHEIKILRGIVGAVGVSDPIYVDYVCYVSASIVYTAIAVCLFGYGTFQAGAWKDTGDKDKLKKFLLIVPQGIIAFLSIWILWGWGLRISEDGVWTTRLADATTMYQTIGDNFFNPENPMGLALLLILFIFGVGWFVVKYIITGILVRADNLKTAMYQFVYIAAISTVIISVVWCIFTIDSLQPYIHNYSRDYMSEMPYNERFWYIFSEDAITMARKATAAAVFGNWARYTYWGLIQELLFLGYWCTLLTKMYNNKHLNAVLSSLCFALIHFPSWPLMIFTCIAGYFWAIAWQRNDSRNLFVMGLTHGYAGTLIARFIPITMSVGPSNMV